MTYLQTYLPEKLQMTYLLTNLPTEKPRPTAENSLSFCFRKSAISTNSFL